MSTVEAPPSVPPGVADIGGPPTEPQARQHGAAVHITLGDVEVPVYAQRHAYLANRLGKTFQGFLGTGEELSMDNFLSFLGGSTYDVLAALIPSLPSRMPKHTFAGYGSQEAMDAGTYDEGADKSPTFPEIVVAFETAWRVNRFDVVGKLGTLVDPTVLKRRLNLELAKQLSKTSASSPPPSGGSGPTPDPEVSGMPDRTAPLSEG